MKELFGQRLREQRLKHHLTLEQVAEKADLSANYIGMVERGLKEPGLATIVKILNALNISADELLCDLVPSACRGTSFLNFLPLLLFDNLHYKRHIAGFPKYFSLAYILENSIPPDNYQFLLNRPE